LLHLHSHQDGILLVALPPRRLYCILKRIYVRPPPFEIHSKAGVDAAWAGGPWPGGICRGAWTRPTVRERRPPRASDSCREAHMSPRHTDAPHPVPHVILSSCGPRVSVCSKKLHATNRNRSKRSERKAEARVEPKSGRHRTAPPATTAGGAEPFGVGVGVVEPCRGPAASRLGVGFLRACSLLLHSMAAGPAEP